MSAQRLVLLLPVFVLGWAVRAEDYASPSTRISISHYDINFMPRQAAPLANPSSTIWTPNPPASSATATPMAPEPTSPTNSILNAANTAISTVLPSNLPTVIYITALPPSTSSPPSIPAKYRKRNKSHIHIPAILLSPYVVAPFSAFLGIIQGVFFAWCCIERRMRLRKRKDGRARTVSLEPGPPYISIPIEEKFGSSFGHDLMGISLNDGDSPSKYSVHGSRYNSSRGSLWLERAISQSSQQPGDSSSGADSLEKAFLWPADQTLKVEGDDPFLVPPSRATTTRTTTNISFRTAEENVVPYNSARHKSIRRNILDRLKFGTFNIGQQTFPSSDGQYKPEMDPSIYTPSRVSSISRIGTNSTHYSRRRDRHGRSDSDLRVGDVKKPERTYSPPSSPRRKEKSLVRVANDSTDTEWIAGSGFRLVQEDPDCYSTPSRSSLHRQGHGRVEAKEDAPIGKVPSQDNHFTPPRDGRLSTGIRGSVSGWLVGTRSLPSQPAEVDKYTILPIHKVPTKRTDGPRTPSRKSSKSRNKISRPSTPKVLSCVDPSILPSSPPQIMSPPLESQLLFCSPFMPPSTSMTLVPDTMSAAETSPPSGKKPKVHSPRPLPLPFASSPDTSPYRNLLGKDPAVYDSGTPPRQASRHEGLEAEISASTHNAVTKGFQDTPAARESACQGALTKVDQIMLKGWSDRGVGSAASPTMFGAMPDGGQGTVLMQPKRNVRP